MTVNAAQDSSDRLATRADVHAVQHDVIRAMRHFTQAFECGLARQTWTLAGLLALSLIVFYSVLMLT